MILLDSVCKVLADNYENTPVYIEETPEEFERPSFLVSVVTEQDEILNYNIYRTNPNFQIVYFGRRDIANQVSAIDLYTVKDKLKELFLLQMVVPVVSEEGSTERARFAKINSFNYNIRLNEGAIYCNLTLDYDDSIPHPEDYDVMENIELNMMQND